MKSIPLLEAMNARLRWLTERQNLISQNIANANTPGYTPKDLEKQDFSSLVQDLTAPLKKPNAHSVTLKVSKDRHLAAPGQSRAAAGKVVESKDIEEITPNKNGVVLEQELLKMADVQMEYNLVLNNYRKHAGILKTALGRNR